MELQQHFEEVRKLIRQGQSRALRAAYTEQLTVYWQVGAYLHHRLLIAQWGEGVVGELADWLMKKDPSVKGFGKRSLYRMKEFYLIWHKVDWDLLRKEGVVSLKEGAGGGKIVDNQLDIIVSTALTQFIEIPNVLCSLNWSHHIEIMAKTKTMEEKVFYLLLASKEKYTVKELQRQLASGLYERQILSRFQIVGNNHPDAAIFPQIFRDKYIFEFLDLPEPFSENDLQKGLVRRLKQFILEIGRDFTFIGEEYRLQVGKQDYFLDLLFYHRELQSLVVIELKSSAFQPEYLGKLNFYLEALDREVRKKHENPSIGILLCTENDKETVDIALSRNISPALIAEYETRLLDKGLLQKKLREWTNAAA